MGFLTDLLGTGVNDPKTQAMGLLAAGLMRGDASGGLLAANQNFAEAPERQMKREYGLLQMDNLRAETEARKLEAQQKQAALDRAARIQQGIPGLFQQPSMTGGEAAPQSMGGVPMFSKPMGVAPMQQTPGGFDVQRAIALGMTPEQISAYAGLQNIGRPEVARVEETMVNGRPVKRQFDKFGSPVGDPLDQWKAPVFQNLGNRTAAIDPVALQERGSFAQGVDPNTVYSGGITMRGQNMTDARAREANAAGKAPAGYRYKPDGSLEAIPGGPADIKAGELGAKAAARAESAITQADSVLGEVRAAKGMVGWNTAGVGGAMAALPQTDARDLAAKLQTIKANLGFDRLQQMRDQSPTGGALGQVAVQELASLQATVASLDQMQSPKQLGTALDKIERHYTNWRNVVSQAQKPQGGATGGWEIREKK